MKSAYSICIKKSGMLFVLIILAAPYLATAKEDKHPLLTINLGTLDTYNYTYNDGTGIQSTSADLTGKVKIQFGDSYDSYAKIEKICIQLDDKREFMTKSKNPYVSVDLPAPNEMSSYVCLAPDSVMSVCRGENLYNSDATRYEKFRRSNDGSVNPPESTSFNALARCVRAYIDKGTISYSTEQLKEVGPLVSKASKQQFDIIVSRSRTPRDSRTNIYQDVNSSDAAVAGDGDKHLLDDTPGRVRDHLNTIDELNKETTGQNE